MPVATESSSTLVLDQDAAAELLLESDSGSTVVGSNADDQMVDESLGLGLEC